MYCYNCGKKIKNEMYKCPYCDIKIDSSLISRLVLENTWNEIAKSCPEITKSYSKTFVIDNKEITIKDNDYIFGVINSFINKLYEQATQDIINYYNYWSFDALIKNGEEYIYSYLLNIAHTVIAFKLKNAGEVNEHDKKFALAMAERSEQVWAPIYFAAEELGELKTDLAERRRAMNVKRNGYWVGGGFGIRGAIKGKIKADIMNAGASVSNATRNFISKAIQSSIDRSNLDKIKKEIKNSNELQGAIFKELDACFVDWKRYLNVIFCKNEEVIEKTTNKIVEMPSGEETYTYDQALTVLEENPYNILAISIIYYNKPDTGAVLSDMAQFLGINGLVDKQFQEADKLNFEHGRIALHSVGYDTNEDELRRTKDVLTTLERNNRVYVSNYGIFTDGDVVREQRYHRKVDELLAYKHIEKSKKIFDDAFNKYSFKAAVQLLAEHNDCVINNLLYYRVAYKLKQEGDKSLISAFNGDLPQIVTDALVIYWHKKSPLEYDSALKTLVKMGHPFPEAYYGQCCYKESDETKNKGVKHLMLAAKKNCALALWYVGRFYKNGSDGMYHDRATAESYLNIAAALGEYNARDELKK